MFVLGNLAGIATAGVFWPHGLPHWVGYALFFGTVEVGIVPIMWDAFPRKQRATGPATPQRAETSE